MYYLFSSESKTILPRVSLRGSNGVANLPRQQQIEQGIAYFNSLREHQLQIKQAIQELKQTNQNS
jgi:hypothetical protein